MTAAFLERVGWFDYGSQIPTHDPLYDGPCLVCGIPLCPPVKTISILPIEVTGPERSYFYRAHSCCVDSLESANVADGIALDLIAAEVRPELERS